MKSSYIYNATDQKKNKPIQTEEASQFCLWLVIPSNAELTH